LAVGDTGGSVELSVAVTDATSCTFSANRSVSGLPATVPCTNGTVLQNVTVPANTKSKAAVYKFKIAVAGSTLKPQKVTVTVVGKQKCSQRTSRSDLAGCDLTGVTLGNLPDSDLAGADLTDATLTGVSSGSITGTPSVLPADWSLTVGYLVGPGAYLNDANLMDADLSGVDLSGAVLTDVASGGITGTPSALPTDWSLTDGYLIGPDADLYYADLSTPTCPAPISRAPSCTVPT